MPKQINIFLINELSEEAKKKAIDNMRFKLGHNVDGELEALTDFCKAFNVDIINYEIKPWANHKIKTTAEGFEGFEFNGIYICDDLVSKFKDRLEESGFVLDAFLYSINHACKTIEYIRVGSIEM